MSFRCDSPLLHAAVAGIGIACGSVEPALAPAPGATPIARFAGALIAHCPSAASDDEGARDGCAEGLASDRVLAAMMAPTVLWGGHDPKAHASYDPDTHVLTRFDSFVYSKIYLSTFMFHGARANSPTGPASAGYWFEEQAGLEILHVPGAFRSRLSPGSYPYPFWHSEQKWNAYLAATELVFVFVRGKVAAIYRTGTSGGVEPSVPATFDGQWRWVDESGREQPKVSLFSYLLAENNPHHAALDRTFRALESEARADCLSCHAPDNPANMSRLVLLQYPNQALVARHALLTVLEAESMPPGSPLSREKSALLLELAGEFARLGDLALAFEAGASDRRQ